MLTCKTCSQEFEKPKTPGRPPVRCNPCRGLKSAPVSADTVVEVPVEHKKPKAVPKAEQGNDRYYVADLLEVLEEYPTIGSRREQGISRAKELAAVIQALVQ